MLRRIARTLGLRRPRALRGPRLARPVVATPIRTERLVLRPYRASDHEGWARLEADPAVRRGVEWPPRTPAEVQAHLRDRTHHTRLEQAGDFLALAVEHDGRLVGDVSMHLREVAAPEPAFELGWIVHPDHAGRGIAAEAARALIDRVVDELGPVTLTAVIAAGNTPSRRLAERLGLSLAAARDGRLVYARDVTESLTVPGAHRSLTTSGTPSH